MGTLPSGSGRSKSFHDYRVDSQRYALIFSGKIFVILLIQKYFNDNSVILNEFKS